jgi:hypothetical protein
MGADQSPVVWAGILYLPENILKEINLLLIALQKSFRRLPAKRHL